MKKTLRIFQVFLCVAAVCGCGVQLQQIESRLCESLVLREGQVIGQEAICLLRPPVSPRDLLPAEISGQGMPLRQRLSRLGDLQSLHQDTSGKKRFTFTAANANLDASCDEQAGGADRCLWFLRATKLSNGSVYDSRLQEMFDLLLRNGFQNGVVSFESVKDPSPGEYVTMTFSAGEVDQIEWRHPREVVGFIPVWSKAFK